MSANERWKSISRTFFQLGTILLSAAIIEIYRGDRITLETGSWLIIAASLMFSRWKMLILLDAES